MNRVVFNIGEDGDRLDKFLSENADELTRTAAVRLIEAGNCTVNGVVPAKNYKIRAGDEIILTAPEPESIDIVSEDIELDIRYEDSDLLIVNKPRGMVVHPSSGHYSGTLVNALMYHCGDSLSGINGIIRPGIVHRIDKDTSGLLLVAKNDMAHASLAEQLKAHTVTREYEAVVHGNLNRLAQADCSSASFAKSHRSEKGADGLPRGRVSAPIGRSSCDRKKMCVTDKNSREAITRYEVIADYGNYAHIRLFLETGRTHQIRVHMSYMGHPVAGDCVYGNGKPKWLNGQCLHAGKLGFIHPSSGEYIEVKSELPDYFVKMLLQLDHSCLG